MENGLWLWKQGVVGIHIMNAILLWYHGSTNPGWFPILSRAKAKRKILVPHLASQGQFRFLVMSFEMNNQNYLLMQELITGITLLKTWLRHVPD